MCAFSRSAALRYLVDNLTFVASLPQAPIAVRTLRHSQPSAQPLLSLVIPAGRPARPPRLITTPSHPAYELLPPVGAAVSFIHKAFQMAITFGSVGDIIATVQAAYKLLEILSTGRGAKREYRDLIVDLRLFHRFLDQVCGSFVFYRPDSF